MNNKKTIEIYDALCDRLYKTLEADKDITKLRRFDPKIDRIISELYKHCQEQMFLLLSIDKDEEPNK